MAVLSYSCLLGALVAAVLAIAWDSFALSVVAVGLVMTGVQVVVLARAAGGFTPVVVPVPVINGVLLSSVLLWDWVSAEAKYGISLKVPLGYQLHAAVIGIVFTAAYTVGALLAEPRAMQMSVGRLSDSLATFDNSFRVPDTALVAVGYAGVLMAIFAWQGALLRGEYLKANGPAWAEILSTALTPLAILALCLAAARPGPWRVVAILGVGVWFLILFGRSTRSLAALPAMILLATAIASGRKVRMRSVLFAAAATVFLLQLAIFGRGNPDGVGIIPLGAQLVERPEEMLSDFSLYGILGNIWISGPLTAVVSQRVIPAEALWVSVNPLPGTFAGWHDIQQSLRLNTYTPYNALGELGAHGWLAVVVVAFAAGFALSLSTRIAADIRGPFATVAMVVVLATVALFSVTVLQYNLRSAARLVWYTLVGVSAIWFAYGILTRPRTGFGRTPVSRNVQESLGR